MLSSNTPNLGLCCNANALDFWHLRISKSFKKPEYYIGQTVLQIIPVRQGQILHPVRVIGLSWTGIDWEYFVELPKNHPLFEPGEGGAEWVNHWLIEPM